MKWLTIIAAVYALAAPAAAAPSVGVFHPYGLAKASFVSCAPGATCATVSLGETAFVCKVTNAIQTTPALGNPNLEIRTTLVLEQRAYGFDIAWVNDSGSTISGTALAYYDCRR